LEALSGDVPLVRIEAEAARIAAGGDGYDFLPVGPRSTGLRDEVDRMMADPRYDPSLAALIDDLVHAQPGADQPLRQQIIERYQRVGDIVGASALHNALSDVLEEPRMPEDRRQELRRELSRYAILGGAESVGAMRGALMGAGGVFGPIMPRAPRAAASAAPPVAVPPATVPLATRAAAPFTAVTSPAEMSRRAREFQQPHSPECLDDFLHDYLASRTTRQFGEGATRTAPIPLSYGLGDEVRYPTFARQLEGANAVLRRTTGEELRVVPGQFASAREVTRHLEGMRLAPGSRGLVIGVDTPGVENHAMRYVIGPDGRARIEGAMGMTHQDYRIYTPLLLP
jgi:hypothetical protein